MYKPAWTLEEVLKYLKEQQGKQFDPNLIDLVFENIDQFKAIEEQFTDKL